MARCSPGDKVLCHLKGGKIVSVYEDKYDDTQVFEIVACYNEDYLIYIPSHLPLQGILYVDDNNYKRYGLDKKFIGSHICYISDHKIAGIHSKLDGLCCKKCKYFFPMAVANQEDGSLICWNCRMYPPYK